MKSILKNKKLIIILIIIFLLLAAYGIFRFKKTNLLDKKMYSSMINELETASENFKSQKDLKNYLTNWADKNNLKYTVDDAGNIIFVKEATDRKKNLAPSVTVCNYNYETANTAKRVLATAAALASTKIDSGQSTVIFVNNENNDGYAYKKLDNKYFPDNAKLVFLDAGKMSYISTSSFGRTEQTVTVPTSTESPGYDTAVKIKIQGIPSDVIDTSISNHTNPIVLFSSVLTKLKGKSIQYQLADIKVGNQGNKYPSSLEATVILNSYNASTLTSYLDKRIEAFEDDFNKDDYPDTSYSYELIDKSSKLPSSVYSYETANALSIFLYAIKNGNYRFSEDSIIPKGYEAGDVYAINCITQLFNSDDGSIQLNVSTQALNETYMQMIIDENTVAANISNCNFEVSKSYKKFRNNRNSLSRTLQMTYSKVNNLSGSGVETLDNGHDTYFTAMTYLKTKNKNMDIVHIKETAETSKVITNMLLLYIQTKGNLFQL